MYCSVDDVKKLDHKNILSDYDDFYIEKQIVLAEEQVNFFTNRSFNYNSVPYAVSKASSLLVLFFIELEKDIGYRQTVSERIDQIQVTYANATNTQNILPVQIIALLRPFVKTRSICFYSIK